MMLTKTKNSKLIFDYNIPEYNEADYVAESDTGIWALFDVIPTKDGRFEASVFFSEFKGDADYKEEIKLKADDIPSNLWNLIHDKINEEIQYFLDVESKDSYASEWLKGFRMSLDRF